MDTLKLIRMLLIAAPFTVASGSGMAKSKHHSSSHNPSQSQARMSDEDVRAKCVQEVQGGGTGPHIATDVLSNTDRYAACVQRYGVRP